MHATFDELEYLSLIQANSQVARTNINQNRLLFDDISSRSHVLRDLRLAAPTPLNRATSARNGLAITKGRSDIRSVVHVLLVRTFKVALGYHLLNS